MTLYGYQNVPKEALVAFREELQRDGWAEIDTAPYQHRTDHLDIPALALAKLRLETKIEALAQAISGAGGALAQLDGRWDASQRKLEARITIAEQDDDQAVSSAGERLRNTLLLGDGLAQTRLSYQDEVAFGERQVALSRAPKAENSSLPSPAEDVATLGLGGLISEIESRTAELAQGVAHNPADGNARSEQIRDTAAACVAAFQAAHAELEAQREAARDFGVRSRIQQLKAPFISLLNRFPSHTRS